MTATTAAFDPTITASTDDTWEDGQPENPDAAANYDYLAPGRVASVGVTITPSGAPGSVDSGTLYVDDANASGEEVAAIPYAYTVK